MTMMIKHSTLMVYALRVKKASNIVFMTKNVQENIFKTYPNLSFQMIEQKNFPYYFLSSIK